MASLRILWHLVASCLRPRSARTSDIPPGAVILGPESGWLTKQDPIEPRAKAEFRKHRLVKEGLQPNVLVYIPEVQPSTYPAEFKVEYIRDAGPLGKYLKGVTYAESRSALFEVGRALAYVHEVSVVAEDLMRKDDAVLCSDIVLSHGDFVLTNILWDSSEQRPVLIDWSAPDWHGVWFEVACSSWDLAVFGIDLACRLTPFGVSSDRAAEFYLAFLEGYASLRQLPETLEAHYLQIASEYLLSNASDGTLRILLLPGLWRLFNVIRKGNSHD